MDVLWMLALMLALILLKMPVAFSIGFTAVVMLVVKQIPLMLIAQRMFTSLDQFTLLAVPLFIFVGEVMNMGGVTERLFGFCRTMLRHVRGGLGHVNVVASIIFAGMSGAAVADAAGLGAIEVKAMRETGYDDDFSAAVTAASSTIGPIIPPSIPLVVYAVLAEQSVGRLFLGGFIPGLMMGLALMALIYILSKKRGYAVEPKATRRERLQATWRAIPSLLTPAIILFGIFGGVISPTESAALAAVYALFLGFAIHRELNIKMLWGILKRTVISSVTVLIIISCCSVLSWIVISSGAPEAIANFLFGVTHNRVAMILLINLVLLILGCFLEANSILLIMVPILLPIASHFGIDLVAFGVIVVLNCMIGLITPPVGLCLYIVADLVKLPVSRLVKPMLTFMVPLVAVLLIISIFPQTVTFLPNLLMGAG